MMPLDNSSWLSYPVDQTRYHPSLGKRAGRVCCSSLRKGVVTWTWGAKVGFFLLVLCRMATFGCLVNLAIITVNEASGLAQHFDEKSAVHDPSLPGPITTRLDCAGRARGMPHGAVFAR